MKKIIALLWCYVLTNTLLAQPYANEWIDHDQTYYKIATTRSGLHRIPTAALQTAGIPLQGSDFALYYLGEEVPIYVTTDNMFGASDYIEFVAEPNNGRFDAALFANESDQLNPFKSLFSDTAMYFLAAIPNIPHARFQTIANDLSNLPAPEANFNHRAFQSSNSVFWEGSPFVANNQTYNLANFDANEGFLSTNIIAGSSQNFQLITPAPNLVGSNMASVTLKIVGKNNPNPASSDHSFRIKIGTTEIGNGILDGFAAQQFVFEIPLSLVGSGNTTITLENTTALSVNSQIALAYLSINYSRLYNLDNVRSFAFTLPNEEKYLEILNFNGGTSPWLYDLTNRLRIAPANSGVVWQLHLPPSVIGVTERRLLLSNSTSTQSLTTIANLTPTEFEDYSSSTSQAEYLIITHPNLLNAANQYAAYRRSNEGKSFSVQIIDIESLYDQYSYGINKHPLAIRHFLNQALDQWAIPPQYVLLLGKATNYAEFATFDNYQKCLVPTYGTPPSDMLLSCRNANTYQPQVAIGRIPATNNNEVIAYLNKLRHYEAQQTLCEDSLLWRKNLLTIVQNDETPTILAQDLAANDNLRQQLAGTGLGMNSLPTILLNGVNQNIPDLQTILNEGVGMLVYSGESISNTWNANFSLNSYNVGEKYPFIFSQTDYLGNVSATNSTLANQFLLSDNNGGIGFADNSSTRLSAENHTFVQTVIEKLSGNAYTSGIGAAFKQATSEYISENSGALPALFAAQTYLLSADPAMSPVPNLRAELSIAKDAINYYNPITHYPILSNPPYIDNPYPYVEAHIPVLNLGRAMPDSVTLTINRFTPDGQIIPILSERFPMPLYRDTISVQIPNTLSGADGGNSVIFFIDADQEISENCDNNNVATQVMEFHLYNAIPSVWQPNIRLYPNPTSDVLYMDLPENLGRCQCRLIDASGRTVIEQNTDLAHASLATNQLASGIYCLQITSASGVYTAKIVKR